MTQVHQRTGPPYSTNACGLAWYVDLTGPSGTLALRVRRSFRDDPVPMLAMASIGPGDQVIQIQGRPGLLIYDRSGTFVHLLYEPMPGVIVQTFSPGHPSPAELIEIVGSLTSVPADDPRLVDYALDESYG